MTTGGELKTPTVTRQPGVCGSVVTRKIGVNIRDPGAGGDYRASRCLPTIPDPILVLRWSLKSSSVSVNGK